jgi:hypothetical protein
VFHCFSLRKRLQLKPYLFILMNTVRWLVVTVVAEPYLETEPFRFGPKRPTEYVMPFKPMLGVADKASCIVFLNDALH